MLAFLWTVVAFQKVPKEDPCWAGLAATQRGVGKVLPGLTGPHPASGAQGTALSPVCGRHACARPALGSCVPSENRETNSSAPARPAEASDSARSVRLCVWSQSCL